MGRNAIYKHIILPVWQRDKEICSLLDFCKKYGKKDDLVLVIRLRLLALIKKSNKFYHYGLLPHPTTRLQGISSTSPKKASKIAILFVTRLSKPDYQHCSAANIELERLE
jgi:hypothetical protein